MNHSATCQSPRLAILSIYFDDFIRNQEGGDFSSSFCPLHRSNRFFFGKAPAAVLPLLQRGDAVHPVGRASGRQGAADALVRKVILRFPSPSLPLFRKRNRMTTIARVVCMQHRIMRRFFHPQDTRPRIDVVTPIPSPRFYYTDRTIFFPIYSRTEDFPSRMPAPYEAAPPPAGGAPTRAV